MEARRADPVGFAPALRGPARRRRHADLRRGPRALRPRPPPAGLLGRRLRAAGAAGGRVRGAGLSPWTAIPNGTGSRAAWRASPGSGAGLSGAAASFGANALLAAGRRRRAQRPGAQGGARPPQRPADEGGADVRHRARPAAAGVRRRAGRAADQRPAHGRRRSSAGGWPPSWARTGGPASPTSTSPRPRPPRSARCTAHAPSTAGRWR